MPKRERDQDVSIEICLLMGLFLGAMLMGLGAASMWAAKNGDAGLGRRLAAEFQLVREGEAKVSGVRR